MKGENINSCLSHGPNWGPCLQPRHVPWPGIEPATFWISGWHSFQWATPARAGLVVVNKNALVLLLKSLVILGKPSWLLTKLPAAGVLLSTQGEVLDLGLAVVASIVMFYSLGRLWYWSYVLDTLSDSRQIISMEHKRGVHFDPFGMTLW